MECFLISFCDLYALYIQGGVEKWNTILSLRQTCLRLQVDLFGYVSSNAQPGSWVMDAVLECNFVEVIQKMWRRDVHPELLEKKDKLPKHVAASLSVINDRIHSIRFLFFVFCLYILC